MHFTIQCPKRPSELQRTVLYFVTYMYPAILITPRYPPPSQCGVLLENVMSPSLSEKCQFRVVTPGNPQEMEADNNKTEDTLDVHIGKLQLVFGLKHRKNRLLILIHHLKDVSLSFQKIIKLTLLDQQNQSYSGFKMLHLTLYFSWTLLESWLCIILCVFQ